MGGSSGALRVSSATHGAGLCSADNAGSRGCARSKRAPQTLPTCEVDPPSRGRQKLAQGRAGVPFSCTFGLFRCDRCMQGRLGTTCLCFEAALQCLRPLPTRCEVRLHPRQATLFRAGFRPRACRFEASERGRSRSRLHDDDESEHGAAVRSAPSCRLRAWNGISSSSTRRCGRLIASGRAHCTSATHPAPTRATASLSYPLSGARRGFPCCC